MNEGRKGGGGDSLRAKRSRRSSPFPATKRRKQHRKGAVFSFEYEREGLEPEKARAGVQSITTQSC